MSNSKLSRTVSQNLSQHREVTLRKGTLRAARRLNRSLMEFAAAVEGGGINVLRDAIMNPLLPCRCSCQECLNGIESDPPHSLLRSSDSCALCECPNCVSFCTLALGYSPFMGDEVSAIMFDACHSEISLLTKLWSELDYKETPEYSFCPRWNSAQRNLDETIKMNSSTYVASVDRVQNLPYRNDSSMNYSIPYSTEIVDRIFADACNFRFSVVRARSSVGEQETFMIPTPSLITQLSHLVFSSYLLYRRDGFSISSGVLWNDGFKEAYVSSSDLAHASGSPDSESSGEDLRFGASGWFEDNGTSTITTGKCGNALTIPVVIRKKK